jgi:hypothetical protein
MGARTVTAVILVLAMPATLACGSSRNATPPGDGGGAAPQGAGSAPEDSGAGPGDSSDGGTDGAEVQPPESDASVANACDDLFNAWVACSLVPDAGVAHSGPRFRQFCENQASLPGSKTTVAVIEGCAHAYMADCSTTCPFPNVGTLPAGAPCNIGWNLQCASGTCAAVRLSDGGYAASCGVCATRISVGQPCGQSGTSVCAQGSYCTGSPTTCTALGALGTHCTLSGTCQPSLTCSSAEQCATPVRVGGSCQSDLDCADFRPCVAGTCVLRQDAGAHCTESDCGYGLECDMTTSTCVAPTVLPGGACGANGQLCIYGSCATEGVCPTIISDGQPCPTSDTETCDVEATCDATGKCSIPGTNVCGQ